MPYYHDDDHRLSAWEARFEDYRENPEGDDDDCDDEDHPSLSAAERNPSMLRRG